MPRIEINDWKFTVHKRGIVKVYTGDNNLTILPETDSDYVRSNIEACVALLDYFMSCPAKERKLPMFGLTDVIQEQDARISLLEQEIAGQARVIHHRKKWVEIQIDYDIWIECLRKHAPQLLPEDEK